MRCPYTAMSTIRPQTMPWQPGIRASQRRWARQGRLPRQQPPASAALISPSGGLMEMSHCTTLSPPR